MKHSGAACKNSAKDKTEDALEQSASTAGNSSLFMCAQVAHTAEKLPEEDAYGRILKEFGLSATSLTAPVLSTSSVCLRSIPGTD